MADDYAGIKWFGGALAAFLSGIGLWRVVPKARAKDEACKDIETLRTAYQSTQQEIASDISDLRKDQKELRASVVELQAICESLDGRITRREVHDKDVHRDLSALRFMLTHLQAIAERLELRIQLQGPEAPARELPRD